MLAPWRVKHCAEVLPVLAYLLGEPWCQEYYDKAVIQLDGQVVFGHDTALFMLPARSLPVALLLEVLDREVCQRYELNERQCRFLLSLPNIQDLRLQAGGAELA